jgi:DNA primase catalytic core
MGLHKLTAGDGYTYLTRQVAAHDHSEGVTGLADYYADSGGSPGRWCGSGITGLGLETGQHVDEEQMRSLFGEGRHPDARRIATDLGAPGGTPEQVAAATALGRPFPVYAGARHLRVEWATAFSEYNRSRGLRWNTPIPATERQHIRTQVARGAFIEQEGRAPVDERELSGFIARESRPATTAVAGYDLTFSPVKSVSTLWAVAPLDIARTIEDAHDAAVADTLAWLECEAAFTRVGRAGIRQVETRGLVATAFTHRDTRASDPDLHTHLAVANRVQEKATGRWYTLDGRMLYQANVAASERYNTRLEAELIERLGVRFKERPDPTGRRPVRELVGVDAWLSRQWSQRRAAIQRRYAELATDFQRKHGRAPTPIEAISLRQHATLDTRIAKHEPRSEEAQRLTWAAEAAHVLGGLNNVQQMVRSTLRPDGGSAPTAVSDSWIAATAATVVGTLEAHRATWQVWHVHAEAQRRVRAAGVSLAQLDATVERLVAHSLDTCSVPLGVPDGISEPAELRRSTGKSVYQIHAATTYTSRAVLEAETWLLVAAGRDDGRRVEPQAEQDAGNISTGGVRLSEAQRALVRDLTQSGSPVQVALAPAGTGKTTALRAVAQVWVASGGTVVGLAPSAQAAHELSVATDIPADTLAKLTWTLAHAPLEQWPSWMRHLDASTLLLVDEAGQAGTVELQTVVEFVLTRGGSVRLIGDDQQLAAVSAGGVMTDLVRTHGAATLTEVRRFTDPAEAAATLSVRDGDRTGLGYYADHRRIHVGDLDTVLDDAFAAWVADRAEGRDALLLAPTRDLATRLNARARAHRLHGSAGADNDKHATAKVCPAEAVTAHAGLGEVTLADGTAASVGDVIVTRRNDRRLRGSANDWVRNGDRWTVVAVDPDGGLRAKRAGGSRTVDLPAAYVRDHVHLGYASTVHAAQGMTVDLSHAVVTGTETRQLLYVALTRGRASNHVYVAAPFDGDPHGLVHHEATHPRTALETLAQILGNDGAPQSATSLQRSEASPERRLHDAALRYLDALSILDPPQGHDRCQDDPVEDAVSTSGPLPWLPGLPRPSTPSPPLAQVWVTYLAERAALIKRLQGEVRNAARAWTSQDAPAWALPLLRADRAGRAAHADDTDHTDHTGAAGLVEDLAVWRAAFQIPDDDTRPTGPSRAGGIGAEHQLHLRARLPESRRATDRPAPLFPPEVLNDTRLHHLQRRLDDLARGGVDVERLVRMALTESRPLPSEAAADALWCRIAPHLGPATLRAREARRRELRPPWATSLQTVLGADALNDLVADPAWPALVAAVESADATWVAEHLIATALRALPSTHSSGAAVDLCEHLLWRVALLTDTAPPESSEPDPEPVESAADPSPVTPTPHRTPYKTAGRPPSPPHHSITTAESATRSTRILELNRLACDYFARQYHRSWAPKYLEHRLGTSSLDGLPHLLGYAPPGPRSLTRHLLNHGARESELVDAGLSKETDRGVIDAFRDRMVFAIVHDGAPVGFIGRRNPTKDDSEYGGPKYLNTRATRVFTKGHLLYGIEDSADALRSGAALVLVEGPLDALAMTMPSDDSQPGIVGVAPLGTAFTATQAESVRRHLREAQPTVRVATDADPAGRAAAHRAFWALASQGADPLLVSLPPGRDPADISHEGSRQELRDMIAQATPLGADLIAHTIGEHQEGDDRTGRHGELLDTLGRIIAASPPDRWPALIAQAETDGGLAPSLLQAEVAHRCLDWPDLQAPPSVRAGATSAAAGRRHDHGTSPDEPLVVKTSPRPVDAERTSSSTNHQRRTPHR